MHYIINNDNNNNIKWLKNKIKNKENELHACSVFLQLCSIHLFHAPLFMLFLDMLLSGCRCLCIYMFLFTIFLIIYWFGDLFRCYCSYFFHFIWYVETFFFCWFRLRILDHKVFLGEIIVVWLRIWVGLDEYGEEERWTWWSVHHCSSVFKEFDLLFSEKRWHLLVTRRRE